LHPDFTNPDCVCVGGHANIADLDVVTAGSKSLTGLKAQRDIIGASG
jgi:hypothetical protein